MPPTSEGLWRAWLHSAAVRDFERGRIDAQTFGARLVAEFELSVGAEEFLQRFRRVGRMRRCPARTNCCGRFGPASSARR